jgi:DNA-binding Lrp family transcriptional regulator
MMILCDIVSVFSVLVASLSILVTTLLVWQVYSQISLDKKIKALIEKHFKEKESEIDAKMKANNESIDNRLKKAEHKIGYIHVIIDDKYTPEEKALAYAILRQVKVKDDDQHDELLEKLNLK